MDQYALGFFPTQGEARGTDLDQQRVRTQRALCHHADRLARHEPEITQSLRDGI
jgi:hypothetical protein